jgi:hypothetical protein
MFKGLLLRIPLGIIVYTFLLFPVFFARLCRLACQELLTQDPWGAVLHNGGAKDGAHNGQQVFHHHGNFVPIHFHIVNNSFS